MDVLVTGGTGNVGRAAVDRLVSHGHRVRVIGRTEDVAIEGAEYRPCDISDFERLQEQVRGMQAVVHLAAIPHPSLAPGQEIFRVNCAGTYNVFRAAAEEGIHRVVVASSINALGFYFGARSFPIRYLPIDEAHPTCTTDPYSFSKQALEAIASYFWRREGISSVCLRLPAVYEADGERWNLLLEFVSRCRRDTEELLTTPPERQRVRIREIIERTEQLHAERHWEQPLTDYGMHLPDAPLIFGRSNFFTSIDARDSAQAIEQGLLEEYVGSHPLYVNDVQNCVGIESEVLAQLFYPDVEQRKRPLKSTEALVSVDAARTLIGFRPKHSIARE
ncbi:MAG: NAD-dependent epimerase/dehydratase family protein [Anaerolineae bacterium]